MTLSGGVHQNDTLKLPGGTPHYTHCKTLHYTPKFSSKTLYNSPCPFRKLFITLRYPIKTNDLLPKKTSIILDDSLTP